MIEFDKIVNVGCLQDLLYIAKEVEIQDEFHIPSRAGIYFLINDNREVIYVGKAKKIKSRINFHKNGSGAKDSARTGLLKDKFTHVKYIEVESESMRTLLEGIYIDMLQPNYNSEVENDTLRREILTSLPSVMESIRGNFSEV